MNQYLVTEYGVKTASPELQTAAFQAVLDLCRSGGGTVVVPAGTYHVAALRMWSDTTLYLQKGAVICGSDNCDDYEIFPIPDGMPMRSDLELIPQYYHKPVWEEYRRAILTAYGEKNISIIGEFGSAIDGRNCYDPNGEEHYRGPHAIFLSCCENVLLDGYTARHSGNFLHEANNCRNLTMRNVTCLGGSDGIHLHFTRHAVIEDCLFKTGDDCIAGINVSDLTVRRCILNTSCNLFRMGGTGVVVEDCYAYGAGYYPHRVTVVRGKNDELPRTGGRHNTLCLVDHFASTEYPGVPSNMRFRNCVFENINRILEDPRDGDSLHSGNHMGYLSLENVRFTDLKEPSLICADGTRPLTIRLKDVSFGFAEDAPAKTPFVFSPGADARILEE